MVNLEKEPSPHAAGINAAIAAELRAERAARGMNNQDVADRSGISKVSVQRYLAPTRAIDVGTLDALAKAVGLTMREVVQRAEDRLRRDGSAPPKSRHDRDVDAALDAVNEAVRGTRPAEGRAERDPGHIDESASG